MIKNFKNLNIVGNRYYSSGEIKHTTLVNNGFGGMLNILGQNQSVKFTTPIIEDNGTVVVRHQVENKPFEPTFVNKKVFKNQLTETQVEEIHKLRPTQSQKQLAEKFNTTPYIISRVSRTTPEKRQSMIDQFLIKNPNKLVEDPTEKKIRLQKWVEQSQQREYDQKVLKAAQSFERIKRHRTALNVFNNRSHQETYDLFANSQKSKFEDNKPKIFTMEEKRAKEKALSKLRRRKVVTEKDKLNEDLKRSKNKTDKKIFKTQPKI
ncbi:hypothetical protein RB653_006796 [Dictyostelium firmibasis]|uniref:Uncharacterized protein n=1 Tax=Dictyostelium firmibasis TaxID=79012 RepID=A0AAN7TUP3_9MYCE